MVATSQPCASTPSIRQELTGLPSTITVQAPQSPTSQPFFVPVSAGLVAQHVEQAAVGLDRELARARR